MLTLCHPNQASLAADLARRRKIKREAARTARAAAASGHKNRGSQAASTGWPGPKTAAISSRSFEAMQSRALRLFRRSVSRFQVLTERDFKIVAELDLLPEDTDEGAVDGGCAEDVDGEKKEGARREGEKKTEDMEEEAEGARNPTPSLSSSSPPSNRRLSLRQSGEDSNANGGSSGGTGTHPDEAGEGGGKVGEDNPTSPPLSPVAVPAAAAILRMLRATVLVLGGCGLGALPSDKELWEAVKPMLLDGSLKHRVRHFDRRVNGVQVGRGGGGIPCIDVSTRTPSQRLIEWPSG